MVCEASPVAPHGAVGVLEKAPDGVDFVCALQLRDSAVQDCHAVKTSHIPTPCKLLHSAHGPLRASCQIAFFGRVTRLSCAHTALPNRNWLCSWLLSHR